MNRTLLNEFLTDNNNNIILLSKSKLEKLET